MEFEWKVNKQNGGRVQRFRGPFRTEKIAVKQVCKWRKHTHTHRRRMSGDEGGADERGEEKRRERRGKRRGAEEKERRRGGWAAALPVGGRPSAPTFGEKCRKQMKIKLIALDFNQPQLICINWYFTCNNLTKQPHLHTLQLTLWATEKFVSQLTTFA